VYFPVLFSFVSISLVSMTAS